MIKLKEMLNQSIVHHQNQSVWKKMVRFLAYIVVFCTTYALILPALTVENKYYCGYEAHLHEESCYEVIIDETLCECENGAETNEHSELCLKHNVLKRKLICSLEEHTHSDECLINKEADVENESIWMQSFEAITLSENWNENIVNIAKTQIGYEESEQNYLIENEDVKKGYTRYGEWYGVPYGDWDTMFVSFVLHYAQVPNKVIPPAQNISDFYDALKENELLFHLEDSQLASGDIVFLKDVKKALSSVAIVSNVVKRFDEEQQLDVVENIEVIQGDFENQVVSRYLNPDELAYIEFVSPMQIQQQIAAHQQMNDEVDEEKVVEELEEKAQKEVSQSKNNNSTLYAQRANVTLKFVSYNEWVSINFPQGNQYQAEVGDTITLTFKDNGGNYYTPVLDLKGAKLVSSSYSCDNSRCNHSGWCNQPTHVLKFLITDTNVTIQGQINGSGWGTTTVEISGEGSGENPPVDPNPPVDSDPEEPSVPKYPHYPDSVETGNVDVSRLRFYNFVEDGGDGVIPLAGCVFKVKGDNGYEVEVVSEQNAEVLLPADIPNGNYTITEVSVPNGYMRDVEYERTFSVKNGALDAGNNIGIFINHKLTQLNAHKSAEVEDYNNRIYEILLMAESNIRQYKMEPIDVIFVVDQSNSMLFPAGLNSINKSVTLNLNGTNNIRNMEALNLDKNQIYYLISDETGTSTVWAIWYDGQAWLYQDASYYAKAKQENRPGYQDPVEKAIFPQNRSYANQSDAEAENERSNGGGLNFSLEGSGLGKELINQPNQTKTYKLYTAMNEYNRLHYLEQALTTMIYELSDYNDENRVTLVEFTKEVKSEDCTGPLALTPDNVQSLINEVRSVNTGGGTRQDIALKLVYNDYLNANKGFSGNSEDTFTFLITDGAPVRSSNSQPNELGGPNDAASTTANTIYGQIKGWANQVKTKSTLTTIGLGMDNVEAGKQVLEEIASNQEHFCALDDASQLVKEMQELLYKNIKPHEMLPIEGDVVDEISDSFYPIAWVELGHGHQSQRKVLTYDATRDWILLQTGDWITLDGKYTQEGAENAAGQLLQKEDGTYYVMWKHQLLSNAHMNDIERIAWVESGKGASSGRHFLHHLEGKDWVLLQAGDWITQDGEYYPGTPSYWSQGNYGQVVLENGEYRIQWGRWVSGEHRVKYPSTSWNAKCYVKAKEDFIGGNAIETNKKAYVQVDTAVHVLEEPTVNVRLLDMNEFQSETTLYLGDMINSEDDAPIDTLKDFFTSVEFTKLVSGGDNVLNKVDMKDAEGLKEGTFTLPYAFQRNLTQAEWEALMAGETLQVEYTYDASSSNGPVGYFTHSLEKTGIEGTSPSYEAHESTVACQKDGKPATSDCPQPSETYRLKVVYTAYRLGEVSRPPQNQYNGSGSPGIEVGTGTKLENGLGTVDSYNIHEVHVISGKIEISKLLSDDVNLSENTTFTFVLHRQEDGDDTSNDIIKTIVVRKGQKEGISTIVFDNLKRGTYTISETVDDQYMLKQIKVLDTTNTYSTPAVNQVGKTVTFVMGHNPQNQNVIGKANDKDRYDQYIDAYNGVYGAAQFTNTTRSYAGDVPVEKRWDDGYEQHEDDCIYVVLYKDDQLVVDEANQAKILQIDASTNWQGSFKVALANENDKVENYHYSIREVSNVSSEPLNGWQKALLENSEQVLYYESALEQGTVFGVNREGYMVGYTQTQEAWIVTNYKTVDLPITGSSFPSFPIVYGAGTLLVWLMIVCLRKYKMERRETH